MIHAEQLFNRLILVGGPPRSGTSLAARLLNTHPCIITAIDDHVYECWGLYYYGTREGLIGDLRESSNLDRGAVRLLVAHLVEDGHLKGAAPSKKSRGLPVSPPPIRPDGESIPMDGKVIRHPFPLERFEESWYLCLKSPEISFALNPLSELFPAAKFVMLYRPILEIAESMYRMGHTVEKVAVYHQRWRNERDAQGNLIPPPGVPYEWSNLWSLSSDFQRCCLYALSYLGAVATGCASLPPDRYFLYNHTKMRRKPDIVLNDLAHFLEVDPLGFDTASEEVSPLSPSVPSRLKDEWSELRQKVAAAGTLGEPAGILTRLEQLEDAQMPGRGSPEE